MIYIYLYRNKIRIENINKYHNFADIIMEQTNMNYFNYFDNGYNNMLYYESNSYKYVKNFYRMLRIYKTYKYIKYDKNFLHIVGSYYELSKNFLYKHRILNINKKLFDMLYSYFIYNKYYFYYYTEKTYHSKLYSISSKKTFNCRDFYKIVVFI